MIFFLGEGIDSEVSKKVVDFSNDLLSHLKSSGRLIKLGKITDIRKMGIIHEIVGESSTIKERLTVYINSKFFNSLKTSLIPNSFKITFASYNNNHKSNRTFYNPNEGDITIEIERPKDLLDIDVVDFDFGVIRQKLYHELSHKLDDYIHKQKYKNAIPDEEGKSYDQDEYVNQRTELFAFYNEIIGTLRKRIELDIKEMFKIANASEKAIALEFKHSLKRGFDFFDVYLISNSIIANKNKFIESFSYIIEKKEDRGWYLNDKNRKSFLRKAAKDFEILQKEYKKNILEKIRKLT